MFGRITPSSRGRRGRIVVLMSGLIAKMETSSRPVAFRPDTNVRSLYYRTHVRFAVSPPPRLRARRLRLPCRTRSACAPGMSSGARPARQHVVLPGETLWTATFARRRHRRPGTIARAAVSAQRADRAGPAAGAAMSALSVVPGGAEGGEAPWTGSSSRSTSSTRSRTAPEPMMATPRASSAARCRSSQRCSRPWPRRPARSAALGCVRSTAAVRSRTAGPSCASPADP